MCSAGFRNQSYVHATPQAGGMCSFRWLLCVLVTILLNGSPTSSVCACVLERPHKNNAPIDNRLQERTTAPRACLGRTSRVRLKRNAVRLMVLLRAIAIPSSLLRCRRHIRNLSTDAALIASRSKLST